MQGKPLEEKTNLLGAKETGRASRTLMGAQKTTGWFMRANRTTVLKTQFS